MMFGKKLKFKKKSQHNSDYFDVAVVGAGPAGTAAAIYAALKGLKVILIESDREPRARPGESLPPGIESIFKQLGVWNQICEMKPIRNSGHYTSYAGGKEKFFHAYGSDTNGTWEGLQLARNILDSILLNRALELGVTFSNQCHIKNLAISDGKIDFLSFEENVIRATHYIDATGNCNLFARNMGIDIIECSPKLIARFGYINNHCPYDTLPIFMQDESCWNWYAEVDHAFYAWVSVKPVNNQREQIYEKHKASGGADVTWRIARQLAGANFFLVGDAACVLDPSAGNGVLRALMTGMMAAHTIFNIKINQIAPRAAYHHYDRWLNEWFKSTVHELRVRLNYFACGSGF